MIRWPAALVVLLGAATLSAQQPAAPAGAAADALTTFLQARTPDEAAAESDRIVASGIGIDEVFRRLKQGRTYAGDVPRGVVQARHQVDTGEYFYTLTVPENYDPARKYQVRVQLHGGVGRAQDNRPRDTGLNRLAGAEQIYVMPYAWRDAPWWSGRQTANLRAILDRVKRTYNVDENRVVLAGVSDGGTGAYYTAMRDSTPFASFLALNGFIMVLRNETTEADGDLFPGNLRNKPMFIVNGGRDPLYPTSTVEPYVAHLKDGGVDLVYLPQPNAGHDTSWWPEVKDRFETFVTDHPRRPLPDTLSWESGPPALPARAHWLVIDRLAAGTADQAALPDPNRMRSAAASDFGIRGVGARINRVVKGSNADQLGLRSGDIVERINNQAPPDGADLAELLRGYAAGRPLLFSVTRGSETVRVSGRYAPSVLPGDSEAMFPPQGESGRVDLVRKGNRVEASTRGVGAFTLLLSPEQFDLTRPVTIVVNGRTVADAIVTPDIRTLLKWAARDNDRTTLFEAELHVDVPH